jgi:hypothetical protein
VWDLWEEVVDDMGADVMVDLVDPAIVPVHRRQAPTKVAPFLQALLQSTIISDEATVLKHATYSLWNNKVSNLLNHKHCRIIFSRVQNSTLPRYQGRSWLPW